MSIQQNLLFYLITAGIAFLAALFFIIVGIHLLPAYASLCISLAAAILALSSGRKGDVRTWIGLGALVSFEILAVISIVIYVYFVAM